MPGEGPSSSRVRGLLLRQRRSRRPSPGLCRVRSGSSCRIDHVLDCHDLVRPDKKPCPCSGEAATGDLIRTMPLWTCWIRSGRAGDAEVEVSCELAVGEGTLAGVLGVDEGAEAEPPHPAATPASTASRTAIGQRRLPIADLLRPSRTTVKRLTASAWLDSWSSGLSPYGPAVNYRDRSRA